MGGFLNTPPAPHSPRHESSVTARVRDLSPISAIEEKAAKSISSTWPKSGRLGGSSRPTAPTESTRFWPSKVDLRKNRQNHHRREADVEVSTARSGASRTETIRRIGGPSKCGRKRSSSTWPIIGSTRGSSRPTVPYHIQPKIGLHQNRFGSDQPTWPEAGGLQMRAKNRQKIDTKCGRRRGSSTWPEIGSTEGSSRPTAPGQNRPKSTGTKINWGDNREPAAAPLDVPSGTAAPQSGFNRPSRGSAPRATAPHCRLQASGWKRNRPRPAPARSNVDRGRCRETGAAPLAASSGAMAPQHSPNRGSPSSAPRATAPRTSPTTTAAQKAVNAGDGSGLVSPSAGMSALGKK